MTTTSPRHSGAAGAVLRRPAPLSLPELTLRASALADRTVGELAQGLGCAVPAGLRHHKGFVGQLVEHALGADPLAGERPDFPALATELKTVPVDDSGRPLASTFVCSIAMADADQAVWEDSRLHRRLARVLWVPVRGWKQVPLGERTFAAPVLWVPSEVQLGQLQSDWEWLMGTIGSGRGGMLTAHEGEVLQVRPKAAHAAVRTWGPGGDDEGVQRMLPLGFYLRPSFTAEVLAGASDTAT